MKLNQSLLDSETDDDYGAGGDRDKDGADAVGNAVPQTIQACEIAEGRPAREGGRDSDATAPKAKLSGS